MVEFTIDRNATEITVPAETTSLAPYFFAACEELKKVNLPSTFNKFPEGLFQGCTSLAEIPFRAGIDEIAKNTFEGCASLKSIVFPDTINAIRSRACADCTSLRTVVLPPKMYALADDAFAGCDNITNIRIDEGNKLFYINEKDGCLYERNVDGDDILKIKLAGIAKADVGFFKENVDDEAEPFFTDEQIFEEDDTFYSEIGDSDMDNENNVDDMLADIMGNEKERTETAAVNVGVSEEELAMLSMPEEPATTEEAAPVNLAELTGKQKIIAESVANYKVEVFEDVQNPREDSDLFVISEKADFSPKLQACAKKVASYQDFKRIIYLTGLPIDNPEFLEFYHHFISYKNVILACEAEGLASLSDYCKTICEESRIILEKAALAEQQRKISVRNNDLIKIIIRDVE